MATKGRPEKPKAVLAVRVTPAMMTRIRRAAAAEKRTVADYLRLKLEEWFPR